MWSTFSSKTKGRIVGMGLAVLFVSAVVKAGADVGCVVFNNETSCAISHQTEWSINP